MDVGQNGRPRGPQMLVSFSIHHPIIGVPNFDPYPHHILFQIDVFLEKTTIGKKSVRHNHGNIIFFPRGDDHQSNHRDFGMIFTLC